MSVSKPNPLQAQGGGTYGGDDDRRGRRGSSVNESLDSLPAVISGAGDESWRHAVATAAVAIEREDSPRLPPTPGDHFVGGAIGKTGAATQMKRVDTAALTGLRGLAALHVALGHMFAFSDLRFDLVGGAAMPFFYLLSGFVMTLGYGQTLYEENGCCCGGGQHGGGVPAKQMDKQRFWRNRFARLFPVYAVTNLAMAGAIIPAGGTGVDGTPQGVLGMILQFVATALGINTWLFPFVDVGMPPNGVTWTITTMSFFYWVFPYLLPSFQRMSGERRRVWIVTCFWIQAGLYSVCIWLWASVVPVLLFNPEDPEDPFGNWKAGLDYDVNGQMGYWVARSFPGSRVFVFSMGCLAALNRLEVRRRQSLLDADADVVHADRLPQPTSAAKGGAAEAQSSLLRSAASTVPIVRVAEGGGFNAEGGAELGMPGCPGMLECVRCCDDPDGQQGLVFGCCAFLPRRWVLNLPTLYSSAAEKAGQQAQWASEADGATAIYCVLVFGLAFVERFVVAFGARMLLEGIVVMMELHIIVSLTYDGRQSYVSRFCNTRAITWLGNISMSFYMVHMMMVFPIGAIQMGIDFEKNPGLCGDYLPGEGQAACEALGWVPSADLTDPEQWADPSSSGLRPGLFCQHEVNEAGEDTCETSIRPERVCPIEHNINCQYGVAFDLGIPIEISAELYCSVCEDAWSLIMPALPAFLIPVALGASLLLGWCLTRWVELPGQTWLRGGGGTWAWVGAVKCFPNCCAWPDLSGLPEWFPSCCPWECCPCVYSIFCCCCCGCCKSCRKQRVDRGRYDVIPNK